VNSVKVGAAGIQPAAKLGRRLASLLYEGILLFGVVFFAAFPFSSPENLAPVDSARLLFQAYLAVVVGAYFVLCWVRGGQTLPMRTWRLRLVTVDGKPVELTRAVARYLFAWLSLLAFGLGFAWAVFDRDRQFLHDRLAGTRLVPSD